VNSADINPKFKDCVIAVRVLVVRQPAKKATEGAASSYRLQLYNNCMRTLICLYTIGLTITKLSIMLTKPMTFCQHGQNQWHLKVVLPWMPWSVSSSC